VQLLARMGGAPPGGEHMLGCCFVFPLLPLVGILAVLAVYRNAAWPAVLALVLVGLPYLVLWGMVAGYQLSDDWEEMDEQKAGYKLVKLYLLLVAIAGLSLCLVIGGRWLRRESAQESVPKSSGTLPASPD
jgi:hypothetical protein